MLSTLIKVKVHRWLPRGYPHAQILKHPGYALHSALRKYPGSRTLQNKSQAQKYLRHGTSSRACGKGRGRALEPRPVQRGPNRAGARARKWGERESQHPTVFQCAPGRAMLALRNCLRKALAPRALALQVGGQGTRDSRAQGDRGGFQVVC